MQKTAGVLLEFRRNGYALWDLNLFLHVFFGQSLSKSVLMEVQELWDNHLGFQKELFILQLLQSAFCEFPTHRGQFLVFSIKKQ